MRTMTLLAAAIAIAIGSGPAKAAVCANITFSPSTTSVTDWDPINPAPKTRTFTATITPIPNATRSVRMIFLDNDTGTLRIGSAGPLYSITNGANLYAFQSGTTLTASFPELSTPGGNAISPNFTITVPANTGNTDYVGGANFSEALRYSIKCYNNGGNEIVSPGDLLQSGPTISLAIPKLVSITTGSPATINFGSFSTATQTLQVGLKSTSSVNVAVATTNVNKMMLAGAGTPDSTNSIPYTMTLNGDAVANGSSLTNRPRAGVPGTNWPLILTLTGGVPTAKLAGSYSDTITLTLTPGI